MKQSSGAVKGTELRWQTGPKCRFSQKTADFRRFAHFPGRFSIWFTKPQKAADFRRFLQETADWGPSPWVWNLRLVIFCVGEPHFLRWCVCRAKFQARKIAQTQTFGSRYLPVRWGSSTWTGGAKKFGMSFKTKGNQTFGRDIPGFCWDIPRGRPKIVWEKTVCVRCLALRLASFLLNYEVSLRGLSCRTDSARIFLISRRKVAHRKTHRKTYRKAHQQTHRKTEFFHLKFPPNFPRIFGVCFSAVRTVNVTEKTASQKFS